eukprot:g906.t1
MHLTFDSQLPVQDYPDLNDFLEQLKEGIYVDRLTKRKLFEERGKEGIYVDRLTKRKLFEERGKLHITRAPGRLDVMGGISDYSGGLVLQLPIEKACFAAVEITQTTNLFQVVSRRCNKLETVWYCEITKLNNCSTYKEANALFTGVNWVGYIAGCLTVLKRENYIQCIPPISIFLVSNVPEGSGVSSSASVEVASMKAFSSALGVHLDDIELAHLCQRVENEVVGAPCGIMDQITSAIGRKDTLLVLSCRPDKVLGHLTVPRSLYFCGVDSGEKHSISGAEYSTVRAATFMGLKILRQCTDFGKNLQYLSELDPQTLPMLDSVLPEHITGRQFLEQYGEHIDQTTVLELDREYPVKAATNHPVLELARVQEFHSLFQSDITNEVARRLGTLMYGSHEGYRRLELDSKWTSSLVRLTKTADDGLIYGCKITGGGSGGSVCVLTTRDGYRKSVEDLCRSFKQETGSEAPMVFWGSSPGAQSFGVVSCVLESEL